MSLKEYENKRKFDNTPEPVNGSKSEQKHKPVFVVQKHDASHLHYDFRLEADGVLKSWAVPKGPSLNPKEKRLAVQVEDHPLDYADFEGIIPKGNYGAGTVQIWDHGTYTPLKKHQDVSKAIENGLLEFELNGKKLKGMFILVRTHMDGKDKNWLLLKKDDEFSVQEDWEAIDY